MDRQARRAVAREDILTQMAYWAGEYQTFPNDLEAAQQFSEALRKGGRFDRAVQVAGEAIGRFPEDRQLLTTYGLAQIAHGNPQDALRPLALVAAAEPENWRVRSALGAALDQLGRFDDARRAYQEALALQPNDGRILTNLGVSHIMAGEPDEAEPILRQAVAQPSAPPKRGRTSRLRWRYKASSTRPSRSSAMNSRQPSLLRTCSICAACSAIRAVGTTWAGKGAKRF